MDGFLGHFRMTLQTEINLDNALSQRWQQRRDVKCYNYPTGFLPDATFYGEIRLCSPGINVWLMLCWFEPMYYSSATNKESMRLLKRITIPSFRRFILTSSKTSRHQVPGGNRQPKVSPLSAIPTVLILPHLGQCVGHDWVW